MIITRLWITDNKTKKGAWTKLQLRAIGIPWPPVSGWIQRAVGREITEDQQLAFENPERIQRKQDKKASEKAEKRWLKYLSEQEEFFISSAWRKLRYKVIRKYEGKCMACNRDDLPLHVDHIKPRSKYPELALKEDNLQILCEDCNLGKSNIDETDWRESKWKAIDDADMPF